MNRSVLAALLLLSLIAPPAFGGGAGITVTTTLDGADPDPDDGICESAVPGCTLRAAIQTANALGGAQVNLGAGVYLLTVKRDAELADDLTGDLDVTSEITVVGQGTVGDVDDEECKEGIGCTAIDGKKGKDRVFDVAEGGHLLLFDVIVRNGKAYKNDLNPTQFEQVSGGCIRAEGQLNLDGVVVHNCKSPDDGGCLGFTLTSSATLVDTFLNRCKTKDAGGAIEIDNGTLNLNRVTIANSKGAQGGGLETSAGTLFLRNVTFSRNKAKQGGGLEIEDNALVSVNNATFFDNKASEGASIFADPELQFTEVQLGNSLLRSAKENNCVGAVASQGGNVENGTDCDFGVNDCSDCFPAILPDLLDNGGAVPTHGLEDFSDAKDSGVSETCEPTDARGAARVGVCDSGAFEFGGVAP